MRRALVELMGERRLESISVTELCRRADLNRSTFYDHYQSVEQLLGETYEQFFAAMDRHLGLESGLLPPGRMETRRLAATLRYLCQEGGMFQLFLSNQVANTFERRLCDYYMERYCGPDAPREQRYAFLYHTIGSLTLVQRWLQEGRPCPEEALAEQINALFASGTQGRAG